MYIYLIEVWEDSAGFSGYYIGPFLNEEEAVSALKQTCKDHGYTHVPLTCRNTWGREYIEHFSKEKLIDGKEPMVKLTKESIGSRAVYHALSVLINAAKNKHED